MPRYVIHRHLGNPTDEELDAAVARSTAAREASFPDITWEHTHVVRTDEGLVTYCVYESPNEERIREHARAAEIPADQIHPIVTDLAP